MLSLSCDYRVMTDGSTRNAWMCMNEVSLRVGFTSSGQNINFTIYLKVHFGASWPLPFGLIARAKVTDATILRKIALEGHRFTPKEAVQWGLIDHIASGDTEGVLSKAQEVAEAVGGQAKAGAYGLIRVRIVCRSLGSLLMYVFSVRRVGYIQTSWRHFRRNSLGRVLRSTMHTPRQDCDT